MKHITAQQKHDILVHIRDRCADERPVEIAAHHGVAVSRSTLHSWQQRWNGTVHSLQRKAGSGRPRILSKVQVTRHVAAPIRNSNCAARAVRYTQLLPQVRAATGAEVSLRTLQHYGKEEAAGHKSRGKKRTADEREYTRTQFFIGCCSVPSVCSLLSASCLFLTSSVS
jgi:hypothetical protein